MHHWIGLLVCISCMAIGCGDAGPTMFPVAGTVSLDGAPIAEGDIIFLDADPSIAPDGGKIENGQFKMQAKPGKKRVEIRASRLEKLPSGQAGAMGETEAYVDYIPARYNLNTELTADVQESGENQFDFPLLSN